ncbi:MAG TPA: phosphatase PAP2 family protein [Candidatus Limnocylindrales bacterium]|nr:phosphatase PAP2 family protein [Candidatus Limnocylindrales bacterium]
MPEAPVPVADQAAAVATDLAAPAGIARTHAAPTRVALVRTRTGRNAVLASLAAFAGLFGLVSAGGSGDIDRAISRALQRSGRPLDPLLRVVSWPGFPPESRLIPPAIVAGLWFVGLRLEALFQLGAWSTALLSSGLKALARRPRPAQADAVEIVAAPLRGSSFPSGHVLTYVGVYGFLAHLVEAHVDHGVFRRAGVAALAGLVGLVGPSRIQQGHHWPTDVLGSYLVGLPLLAVYIEAYRWTKARLLGRRP